MKYKTLADLVAHIQFTIVLLAMADNIDEAWLMSFLGVIDKTVTDVHEGVKRGEVPMIHDGVFVEGVRVL